MEMVIQTGNDSVNATAHFSSGVFVFYLGGWEERRELPRFQCKYEGVKSFAVLKG
jgi:hypothetical protein